MIAMLQTIPVIDIADYLAGRAGALEATAARVRDALTTVGFFVLTGHDVPYGMIERTFAEAVRFHDLPIDKKLGLKLNEHVNGYMAMSRYAVWTSDVNNNDKPDLNEAFLSSASGHLMIRCGSRGGASSDPICGPAKPTCRVFAPACSNMPIGWTVWRAGSCRRSRSISRRRGSTRLLPIASSRSGCRTTRRSRPRRTSSALHRTPTATL